MPHFAHVKTSDVVELYRSGKSATRVGAIVGLSEAGVYQRLKTAGVARRSLHERFPHAFHPVEELIALYESGLSCIDIGARFGLSYMTVAKRLHAAGVRMRPAGSGHKGKFVAGKSPMWKGGRHIDDKGYVKIWVGANGDYALEHRLVVEKRLGRKLQRHEHVHHLNGIRTDNRDENLEVTDIHRHERGTLVKALQRRIRELESQLHPST